MTTPRSLCVRCALSVAIHIRPIYEMTKLASHIKREAAVGLGLKLVISTVQLASKRSERWRWGPIPLSSRTRNSWCPRMRPAHSTGGGTRGIHTVDRFGS